MLSGTRGASAALQGVVARSAVADRATATTVAVFAVHRLDAEALAALLAGADGVEVACVAADLDELSAAVAGGALDVVLLAAPVQRAVSIAAGVRASAPRIRCVVVAEPADAALPAEAAATSIEAVVARDSPAAAMVMAVQQVAAGSTVYPARRPVVSARLRTLTGAHALSPRQRDVLRLLAEGRTNTEIAEALYISVNTVKFHLRCIFRELGLHNRVQAAQRYAELAGPQARSSSPSP